MAPSDDGGGSSLGTSTESGLSSIAGGGGGFGDLPGAGGSEGSVTAGRSLAAAMGSRGRGFRAVFARRIEVRALVSRSERPGAVVEIDEARDDAKNGRIPKLRTLGRHRRTGARKIEVVDLVVDL